MADFFIKGVPLPVSRPSGINPEYQPSIDAGMPFKATEKAVDAFSEGARYHPTSQPLKPLSELPRGLQSILEKIHEMNAQFFGWLSDSFVATRGPDWLDVMIFLFIVGAVIITGMVIWTALRLFVEWVVGNRE